MGTTQIFKILQNFTILNNFSFNRKFVEYAIKLAMIITIARFVEIQILIIVLGIVRTKLIDRFNTDSLINNRKDNCISKI